MFTGGFYQLQDTGQLLDAFGVGFCQLCVEFLTALGFY